MGDETTNSTPAPKTNSGRQQSRRAQTPVVTNTSTTAASGADTPADDTGTQALGGGIPIKPPPGTTQSTSSDVVDAEQPAAVMGGGIPIRPPASAVQVIVEDQPASADPTSLVIQDSDDQQVKDLKILLKAFAEAVAQPGELPKDYRRAATLASQITQLVIQFPKTPVLDALLAFFEDHRDTAGAPENMLKGATTLTNDDQQRIGYLFGLFADLARRSIVSCDTGKVVQVLKKPEIPNYYNRRAAGIRHSTR